MNCKNLILRITGGVLLIVILAGCSSPTPSPTPTVDVQPTLNAVKTQSALTVIADSDQNAPSMTPIPSATKTATLAPSNTVLPSATKTATYIPWTATTTVTQVPSALSCSVTSFAPALNTSYGTAADFDATWTIKNIGTQPWTASEVDISYSSGDKLQKSVDAVDLNNNVAVGESYSIIVDMHTPSSPGTYTTTWVVASGTQVMCSVTFTIIVQ